ncbi:MAG: hypothetical protein HQL07_13320 [Nitrospirae bacterium]|nr:hypothetical protein [Magnetococcales bacterium]HAT51140.1 hypothetical protein [Alphaproteobacteria bacterium]
MATIQKGSAMLALMALLVVVLGASFYYFLDPRSQYLAEREGTMRRMAWAVSGLVAYSGQSAGLLPCPDLDFPPDGRAEEVCTPIPGQLVGWLPWRTLGLPPLRDEAGNPLLYVVAPGSVNGGIGQQSLKLGNRSAAQAAVVIAPGMALFGQKRSQAVSQGADWVREWLEGANQTAARQVPESVFEQQGESLMFNDRLLPLPVEQLVKEATDKDRSH